MPAKPVLSMWIPPDLRPLAQSIHADIKAIARRFAVPMGEVAQALLEFAWEEWRRGWVSIAPRQNPNPRGRRMRLTLGWRAYLSSPKPQPRAAEYRPTPPPEFLAFRMAQAKTWKARISDIAEDAGVAHGAVLTYLLAHALDAHHRGALALFPQPVLVLQSLGGWERTAPSQQRERKNNLNFLPEHMP